MGRYLADALRRKLAALEDAGETERAAAVQRKLKTVEKADKVAPVDVKAASVATEPAPAPAAPSSPPKRTRARKTSATKK